MENESIRINELENLIELFIDSRNPFIDNINLMIESESSSFSFLIA